MIKVIIKRSIASGLETHFDAAIQHTLHEANTAPGYVSGVNLQQDDNPRGRLMITTWENKAAWEAWKTSPSRQHLVNTIAPMLDAPENIQIYNVNIS